MAAYWELACGNCGTKNVVATCNTCSRPFVVTLNRVTKGERLFDDEPLDTAPDVDVQPCDFCLAQHLQLGAMVSVPAGLRQRTCPNCKTEFLSGHGL